MSDFRERNLESIVGAFILGTLLLAAGWMVNNAWFQGTFTPVHRYTLELEDGVGLGVGTKVTIAGMEVGQVTEVVLTDDRRVRVGLNVESTYAGHVRTDSVGSAAMTLSGKVVRIEAGSLESPPLEDGGTLVSGSNFDVLRALENMDLVDNIERLEAILIDLNELAGQMNLGDGRLPETVEGLLQLVEDLQEGRGTVGRLLKDEATLNEITDAIGAIDRMAGSVESAAGALRETTPGLDEAAGAVVSSAGSIGEASTALTQTASSVDDSASKLADSLQRLDAGLVEMERTLQAIQKLPLMRGAVRRTESGEAPVE